MSLAEKFRQEMDSFASAVVASENPVLTSYRRDFLNFDGPYPVAGTADQAIWLIAEIEDNPTGPLSLELCTATMLEFVSAWLGLHDRDDENVQRKFFEAWETKAYSYFPRIDGA